MKKLAVTRFYFAFAAFVLIASDCVATPLVIGKIPANRTVKIKLTVQVNDPFPKNASSIMNGGTFTSSNASTFTLTPLAENIIPNITSVVTLPDSGDTRSTTPVFTGTAIANSTVEIYDGDTLLGSTTANSSGSWSFSPPHALAIGDHTIRIRTISGGNTSNFTTAVTLRIDCPVGDYGSTCQNICPGGEGASACSGRGTCSDGIAGTGACSCTSGNFGTACEAMRNVCAVDLASGLLGDSDWDSIKSVVRSNDDIGGKPYFWNANKWTTSAPTNYRFTSDPKSWFSISNLKTCLGNQTGTQILYLLLQSQSPVASYYDNVRGKNYRFGVGPESSAKNPAHRLTNIIWKMMAYPSGSIFYVVLKDEYKVGDSYTAQPFRSVGLYKESAGNLFTAAKFGAQTFNPDEDTFLADLGSVFNSLTPETPNVSTDGVPISEIGVDLVKLFGHTGWSTSTSLMIQGVTQAVTNDTLGHTSVSKIDQTGTAIIPVLDTIEAPTAPVLATKQDNGTLVTLICQPPHGVTATRYYFQTTKFSTNVTVNTISNKQKIAVKLSNGSSYNVTCSYSTADNGRSSTSAVKRIAVR